MVPSSVARSSPANPAWRSGVDLAIRMVEAVERVPFDEAAFNDEDREGRPQRNLAFKYLRELQGLPEEGQVAFAAVLTELIGNSFDFGTDLTYLRRVTKGVRISCVI